MTCDSSLEILASKSIDSPIGFFIFPLYGYRLGLISSPPFKCGIMKIKTIGEILWIIKFLFNLQLVSFLQ